MASCRLCRRSIDGSIRIAADYCVRGEAELDAEISRSHSNYFTSALEFRAAALMAVAALARLHGHCAADLIGLLAGLQLLAPGRAVAA